MRGFILVLNIFVAVISISSAVSTTAGTRDAGGNVNCINCKGCTGCVNCVNCTNCHGCVDCHNCNGLNGSVGQRCQNRASREAPVCADSGCTTVHNAAHDDVLQHLIDDAVEVPSKFVAASAPAKTSHAEVESNVPFVTKLNKNTY